MLRARHPLVVGAITCLLVFGFASPALAHDPIFLTADQTTPDTGPYMPDGSISWALYGSVLGPGDTRGFEFDLRDGDQLVLSLLIPNLEPELSLTTEELPTVSMTAPDGSTFEVVPNKRTTFDEPFSNTSYVDLADINEPGQAGRYQGVVNGNAPARWSFAIGVTEIFFTETERSGDRPSSFAEISEPLGVWYSTPPGGELSGELSAGTAEIQMDLIEDAMSDGDATAPEDALGQEADAPQDVEAAVADASDEPEDSGPTAAPESTAVPEPTAAPAATEPPADASEVAAAADVSTTDSADDSSSTWVAPVVIGVLALVGAGAWFARRESTT